LQLSGPLLQQKAKDLATRLDKPDFKPTTSWFRRWKERNVFQNMSYSFVYATAAFYIVMFINGKHI